MPTCSIAGPSKIYPDLDFWFENKPSGNPEGTVGSMLQKSEKNKFFLKRIVIFTGSKSQKQIRNKYSAK
jgi:ribosomal protein L13